jgi:phosphoenolpyruvate-protein phosphotransferase (PTS system enzyme I)
VLGRAESELLALKQTFSERIGASEAEIFAAQLLVLGGVSFHNPVLLLVRDKHLNVEAALSEVIEKFTHAFDEISDPYLRERAADIRDVGRRVLDALIEERGPKIIDIPRGAILVAEEPLPSVTARLEFGQVRALVTERGRKFSHTSVLARSLDIPAAVFCFPLRHRSLPLPAGTLPVLRRSALKGDGRRASVFSAKASR